MAEWVKRPFAMELKGNPTADILAFNNFEFRAIEHLHITLLTILLTF